VGAVVLVAVANIFNIGADIGSMAAAAGLLVPVPYAVATIAFAMVMVMLEVAVPYHRYARVLRWLALSLLAYVAVLVVVQVDWAAALAPPLCPECMPTGRTWRRCWRSSAPPSRRICSSGRRARRSRSRPNATIRWTATIWRRCGWTWQLGWARGWA
jgi:Natural resistance-associated macrophage protein